jgi:rhodanese-related sulfurtransferase
MNLKEELKPLSDAGAVVVDVRMPDEYAEAHLPGALLIGCACKKYRQANRRH